MSAEALSPINNRSTSPKTTTTDDVAMKESIPPSRVLGVFGMSMFTRRDDLERVFREFGPIERAEIISNRQTGRSKGFGFVYFEKLEDAEVARLKTNGLTLNERQIRVDFSRTESAHNPTPGFYNGKPISELKNRGDRDSRDSRDSRGSRRYDDRVDRYNGRDSRDRRSDDRRMDDRRTDRYTPSGSRTNNRSRSRSPPRRPRESNDREYRPRRRSLSRD